MKLTIDNLNGAGESDYSGMLDSAAPPKIVRKLNQPAVLTAWLACQGTNIAASAGSKVRLYNGSGGLWFSGYLAEAPLLEFAGEAMGKPVFRAALNAKGELAALDRTGVERTRGDGWLHGGRGGYGAYMRGERGLQCFGCAGCCRGGQRYGGERRALERKRWCSR